jgi:nucleoside recognition membrane protein YjiH
MTEFLMGWIVVLLAMICLYLKELAPQKVKTARESVGGLIGELVTSFLCALIFYGLVSLLWKFVLNTSS